MQIATKIFPLILSAVFYATASHATTNTIDSQTYSEPIATTLQPLAEFYPQPSNRTQIGYGAWSELLGDIILFMGPSTRIPHKAPARETGTRLLRTHVSPFRLEGNKVLYPHMKSNIKTAIRDYVSELESIGNRITISTMPRNEQLAYWINLHNAVVIREVMDHYPGPKRRPENIRPIPDSDATLHAAKLITVNGVSLSLQDIRERIVYPNWKNPDVAMAFYLGDSSSPSLSNEAYNATLLGQQLKKNAEEYANSLRGMDNGKVSRIYHDISPWYFPNFSDDLETYFQKRMRAGVFDEYVKAGYRGVNRYDNVVNDITAGFGERGRQRISASSDVDAFRLGRDVTTFLDDRIAKIEKLRKQPWFKPGTVTIVDIETEDGSEVE